MLSGVKNFTIYHQPFIFILAECTIPGVHMSGDNLGVVAPMKGV